MNSRETKAALARAVNETAEHVVTKQELAIALYAVYDKLWMKELPIAKEDAKAIMDAAQFLQIDANVVASVEPPADPTRRPGWSEGKPRPEPKGRPTFPPNIDCRTGKPETTRRPCAQNMMTSDDCDRFRVQVHAVTPALVADAQAFANWCEILRQDLQAGKGVAVKVVPSQASALLALADELRAVAQRAGPMHSWWDVISDMEACARGQAMMVTKTPAEWIACGRTLLAGDASGRE